MRTVCEKWFDSTYWGVDLPSDWAMRQDKSQKGWPFIFASATGARLAIKADKNVKIDGWDLSKAPIDLAFEQKVAYLLTLVESTSDLTKDCLGKLVGFSYTLSTADDSRRIGYFSYGSWMLHVAINFPNNLPKAEQEDMREKARSILASVFFCGSNLRFDTDAQERGST